MAESQTTGPVQIHKYPNRRYYDTSASGYVTLEQLHEMIRAGREIRVSDSRTGEDITAKVLAQIVLENEPLKLNLIPLDLLHELIRVNTRAAGLWEEYYKQAMHAMTASRRSLEQGVRQAMEVRAAPQAMLPDWLRMVWGPLAPPSFLFTGGAPPATPPGQSPSVPSAAESKEHPANGDGPEAGRAELVGLVEQLTARLAALEARLAEKTRKEKRPPRRRPR